LKVKLSETELGKEIEELLRDAVILTCTESEVKKGEISLALVGDSEIRELNLAHLGVDSATDVIAFALYGPGETVVGDIYIGHQQAEIQSSELGIPLEVELVRLAIHGTLHVLGHDHPESDERFTSEMFRLQESLVQGLIKEKFPK